MKKIAVFSFAAVSLLLLSAAASAQTKPQWVQNGVKALNRARSNDGYEFRTFTTTGQNIRTLEAQGLMPLKEYAGGLYGVGAEQMLVDTLDLGGGETALRISLPSSDGSSQLCAQLVDEWSQFNDDIDEWGFDLHRLYAISEGSAAPQFDDFTLTSNYGLKPMWMSLIPGVGQIYKGQKAKGYAILGSEVVLAGVAIYSAAEMARYNRLARKSEAGYDSYKSTVATFRSVRNAALIVGGALYVYNLVDAAVAKGARRVVVKRPDSPSAEFAFVPVVTECGAGVGVAVTF